MQSETHHSIEILKTGEFRYIPKELAYCNTWEYIEVCRLLHMWQSGALSYFDFRTQCIYKILKLKIGKRKINTIEQDCMFSNLNLISELMDSFFDIHDKKDRDIKLRMITNPIPKIRPVLINLYGPETRFTNTTFGQYEDAVNIYHMYHRNQNIQFLFDLMATYYLPSGTGYKSEAVKARAKLIKQTVDFAKVYGFFLYFSAFQNYITSSKVLWENNIIDLSILFTGSGDSFKSEIPGLGMKSIGFQLAESRVFGTLKEVRTEKLWEILLRLYDVRKRDLDNEKRAKEEEQKAKSKRS